MKLALGTYKVRSCSCRRRFVRLMREFGLRTGLSTALANSRPLAFPKANFEIGCRFRFYKGQIHTFTSWSQGHSWPSTWPPSSAGGAPLGGVGRHRAPVETRPPDLPGPKV